MKPHFAEPVCPLPYRRGIFDGHFLEPDQQSRYEMLAHYAAALAVMFPGLIR
jgi:hypothetical protein